MKRNKRRFLRILVGALCISLLVVGLFRYSAYHHLDVANQIRLQNDMILQHAMTMTARLLQQEPFSQKYNCSSEKWPSDSLQSRRLKALHSAIHYLTKVNQTLNQDVFTLPDLYNRKFTCTMYEMEGLYERASVDSVWGDTSTHDRHGVTLVTQLSVEKLNMLSLLVDNWPGSISAALHVDHDQLLQLCRHFIVHHNLLAKSNLDIHIVLQRGVLYPVNVLRQLALDSAKTDHVFLVDADFIPDPELHKTIQTYISKGFFSGKNALVVPCFQFNWSPGKVFPKNKQQLLNCWDINMIQPFTSCGFKPGVRLTNYSRWRETSEPYKVEQYFDGYEPYIVARKEGLPKYNKVFLGRIRDKISHLANIVALGYSFTVIPSNFIIHIPHAQECAVPYDKCAFVHYRIFHKHLQEKYPETFGQVQLMRYS